MVTRSQFVLAGLAFAALAITLVSWNSSSGTSSGPTEKGRAHDCFGYTAPPGWTAQPSKTKADLVLASPTECEITPTKMMSDTFIIRYLPFPGSLDSFKTALLAQMTQANLDQLTAQAQREHPDLPAVKPSIATPTVTAATIGGREAFVVDVHNTVQVDDTTVPFAGVTAFIKFGDEVVSIATAHPASRTEIPALATAFLASVNFARCP